MNKINIIRAWKDPVYRNSLSEAEHAALPEHPSGTAGLSPLETASVMGGACVRIGWSAGWMHSCGDCVDPD